MRVKHRNLWYRIVGTDFFTFLVQSVNHYNYVFTLLNTAFCLFPVKGNLWQTIDKATATVRTTLSYEKSKVLMRWISPTKNDCCICLKVVASDCRIAQYSIPFHILIFILAQRGFTAVIYLLLYRKFPSDETLIQLKPRTYIGLFK
jgi:hypothetical protein